MVLSDKMYKAISKSISEHSEELASICQKIHSTPELNYQEFQAHDNICQLLESLGYIVKRHAYGLMTSFEVEFGSGGKVAVFNAEYDALPGLGHACGHNLIATSSIAAFIATAAVIRDANTAGRVRLLGTPAEEGGGGKIRLMQAGAYEGVDACLMAHPTGRLSPEGDKAVDGHSVPKTSACRQVQVVFQGQNAHAGMNPWHGRNALDAVVSSYVNISLLRQQLPPTARVQGVIKPEFWKPNIIPDSASLEYCLRDVSSEQVHEHSNRVEACFEAGALGTGCTVNCDWRTDQDYRELRSNIVLSSQFTKHMKAFGKTFIDEERAIGASTDMGNVTFHVPGIHPMFSIGSQDPTIQPHTPKFAAAAGTEAALERALDCSKGLAATACSLLLVSGLADTAWDEFRRGVDPIAEKLR